MAKEKTTKEVANEAKEITIELIKKLKELSGVGLTDAKKALVEAKGDFDQALAEMRKKGLTKAEKRGDRETREGIVDSYVHDGRIAAIIEVNCETSFVAKTDEFKDLAHKLAMQVASMNPQWVTEAEIPADKLKEAQEAAKKSLTGKEPANRVEQIIAAKVSKTFADRVLMSQSYIFDDAKTVAQFIKDTIAKTGENITVKQFKRIELGVTE